MGKGTEMDIISLLSGWWSLQGNDSSCLKRRRKEIKKKVKVWISVVMHFLYPGEYQIETVSWYCIASVLKTKEY